MNAAGAGAGSGAGSGAGPGRERYGAVVARLAAAQKSSVKAPAWTRWVNRPLGRGLAAGAFLLGLTPNQITLISATFTFGALAAVVLVPPTTAMAVGVSLALLLGYAFDSADGQLARLRGGGSPLGEWLDHVTDALKVSSVHLAVAVSWLRFWAGEHAMWVVVPLTFSVVATTFYFALNLTHQLRRTHGQGQVHEDMAAVEEPRAAALPSLLTLPNDYGLLCLSFALLATGGVFAGVYTALLLANGLFLVYGLATWYRELSRYPSTVWAPASTRAQVHPGE